MRSFFTICTALLVGSALFSGSMLQARERLGIYQDWAAFKDPDTPRCYAIAAPNKLVGGRQGDPYLSIGFWPKQGVSYQIYVQLSRPRSPAAGITLSAGGRRFRLSANKDGGWAADRRTDLAIIAAIRNARSLSIESIGRDGRAIVDAYALRGAPSAIDAAALGCRR